MYIVEKCFRSDEVCRTIINALDNPSYGEKILQQLKLGMCISEQTISKKIETMKSFRKRGKREI
jgi:hypothetical protein